MDILEIKELIHPEIISYSSIYFFIGYIENFAIYIGNYINKKLLNI